LTGDFDFEALTGILARDLLRLTRLVYAGFTVGFRVLAFARELGCLAFSGDLLYFLTSGFLIDLLGDKDF